jgi:2-dehydropantoate 2-reductase
VRYIVYGAGAVGGVVGACLFKSGREVVMIGRGAHLEAIQRDGLRLRRPDGEETLRIPAVGHPSAIDFRTDDAVLLTVKTQDTEAALIDLEAAAGNDLPVFCCQNGVENERLAARRFRRVYGVYEIILVTYLTPGLVQASSTPVPGILDVGCFPAGTDATASAVSADLAAAGLSSRPVADIMRWKYAKLLSNLPNPLDALCGSDADARDIAAAIRSEAEAALAAAAIAHVSGDEAAARRRNVAMNQPVPHTGNSTWQSVTRGAGSVESDFLNGEIVLIGRIHGVPTPYNEAVRRLANRVARAHQQPGGVTPAEIRALAAQIAATVAV